MAVPIVGRLWGSGRQLTAEQGNRIQQLIQARTPDHLNLTYALWTRQAGSELIEGVYVPGLILVHNHQAGELGEKPEVRSVTQLPQPTTQCRPSSPLPDRPRTSRELRPLSLLRHRRVQPGRP